MDDIRRYLNGNWYIGYFIKTRPSRIWTYWLCKWSISWWYIAWFYDGRFKLLSHLLVLPSRLCWPTCHIDHRATRPHVTLNHLAVSLMIVCLVLLWCKHVTQLLIIMIFSLVQQVEEICKLNLVINSQSIARIRGVYFWIITCSHIILHSFCFVSFSYMVSHKGF
jgi:hypothetical protein